MSLDFTRRLRGQQEKMVEVGLDLVVFGSCQNFQYLTGLLMDWRRHWDAYPKSDHPDRLKVTEDGLYGTIGTAYCTTGASATSTYSV